MHNPEDYRRPKSHNVSFVAAEKCNDCKSNADREQSKRPLNSTENVKIVYIGCEIHPTD